jgi:hypothetical protein
MNHASLPVCFRLSVRAVRCYSHLARPCEVLHSWGGKTCGLLISRSYDARPESGDMTGVMTSTRVGKCDRSRDIRSKSYVPIGDGHTTRVVSSDLSRAYDRSHTNDRSHDTPTLYACIMGNIRHENLSIAPNNKKGLASFTLRAIRSIIHSARWNHSPRALGV